MSCNGRLPTAESRADSGEVGVTGQTKLGCGELGPTAASLYKPPPLSVRRRRGAKKPTADRGERCWARCRLAFCGRLAPTTQRSSGSAWPPSEPTKKFGASQVLTNVPPPSPDTPNRVSR